MWWQIGIRTSSSKKDNLKKGPKISIQMDQGITSLGSIYLRICNFGDIILF